MKICRTLVLAIAAFPATGEEPGKPVPAPIPVVDQLLRHPILTPGLPVTEAQTYCGKKVPAMPALTTLEAWQAFANRTRQEVLQNIVFRGETARKWRDTPGKVEWQETLQGGPGYHIRKVRYEALPGLWIPALLYHPEKTPDRMPLYLAVNGHDGTGKAATYKQIRCINLAKRGVACLNVEWIGMGQLRGDGFTHARMNQLDLCGVSGLAPHYLAMSRGIDLLLALPHADASRMAVSGLSGGGWQTITISSLDTRVTLCNPVAGYSSFRTRAEFPSDLGDSEQTPNDLATVADYAHLTAMLGGRAALLTFNAKDNCCFAADHALQPLLDAAEPVFKLHGQPDRLRWHINTDPGTHNYEIDNRQAFYRMVGDVFFPGDTAFNATEIPCDGELKGRPELDVPLPETNLDFHQLALAASQGLPRKSVTATREDLGRLVKHQEFTVVAKQTGTETREGTNATFWTLRLSDTWSVPVTELTRGTPIGTTLLLADEGRQSAGAEAEALLAAGQRVLAVDPFTLGESAMGGRTYLYALLVATVGDRALGIESGQIAAAAHWAREQFRTKPALRSLGPRTGLAGLVAAAMDPAAIGPRHPTQQLESLQEILRFNWTVSEKPELFCFGLLESFDIPQLETLATP